MPVPVPAPALRAAELGSRLAGHIDDPEAFTALLEGGLVDLQDADYLTLLGRACPGGDHRLAVRRGLRTAIERPLRAALRRGSDASALWLAERLARSDVREVRLFALPCLQRALGGDPERSWQLLRRLGTRAGDWIEVDSLAETWALGVLDEPFRWAEIEQLVYSQLPMERRLVGASLACLPARVRRTERGRLAAARAEDAFRIVAQLMGDAEPMVQKSLSWAVRTWAALDPRRAEAFLRDQYAIAVEHADGYRAWVIRDSLPALAADTADDLRTRVRGIRRRAGLPPTSTASRQAAAFAAATGPGTEALVRQGERFTRSHP
jgi:3-methyladenine DNA glycosylase AlkD